MSGKVDMSANSIVFALGRRGTAENGYKIEMLMDFGGPNVCSFFDLLLQSRILGIIAQSLFGHPINFILTDLHQFLIVDRSLKNFHTIQKKEIKRFNLHRKKITFNEKIIMRINFRIYLGINITLLTT